jgi:hypothetical protein
MACNKRGRAPQLSAVLAVVLAGCSGGGAPAAANTAAPPSVAAPASTPSAAPTASPTASPTPEPTIDLKASGTAYLAMSAKLKKTIDAVFKELGARSHKEAAYIKLNQQAADAYRTAITDLNAIPVPDDVKDDVATLAGVFDKLAKEFEHTVSDPSYDNVDATDALMPAILAPSKAIRAALGLPPPG